MSMTSILRLALASAALLVGACGSSSSNNNNGDGGGDECDPGQTQSCYSGDPSTVGNGPCKAGQQTCGSDHRWADCQGEVVPTGETCGDSIDNNCNGTVDEDVDADGDGATTCGGDCCDSATDGCGDPKLVGPGAFEVAGNMVDDNCDGMVDNAAAANCDTGLASNSSDPFDYAKAIELCERATQTDKKWGVISATFTRADGNNAPNNSSRSIRPAFGATTVQSGAAFAVLSTGVAAAPNQTSPNFASFQTGQNMGTTSGFPADWLAANGNALPNAPGCPAASGNAANDPVMLTLTVRVPTNAKSFKLRSNFFSSEYPEWTCSPYNDFFVVLLDSTFAGTPANPTDKNLATYTSSTNMVYPVGVNLAYGNTGLFTVCQNGPTGCTSQATDGNITTCLSNAELANTGFDGTNPGGVQGQPGYCGVNNQVGGGTGWLTTSGNVVGGEVITLRIAIWDTSDHVLDSVVLIDKFEWSIDAAQPGTVIL
jgi:hypothetical protein